MVYGIGLKGREPSWEAVPGRTVLQDSRGLAQAEVLENLPEDRRTNRRSPRRPTPSPPEFAVESWAEIDPSVARVRPGRRSRRQTFLEETGAFAAGEFQVVAHLLHRRRALPEDQRGDRLPRLPPRAAPRRGRGRRTGADTNRARAARRRPRRSTRTDSASTSTWSATSGLGANRRRCSRSAAR